MTVMYVFALALLTLIPVDIARISFALPFSFVRGSHHFSLEDRCSLQVRYPLCLANKSSNNNKWERKKERERERERETETERDRDRETDREKERDKQTDRQTEMVHSTPSFQNLYYLTVRLKSVQVCRQRDQLRNLRSHQDRAGHMTITCTEHNHPHHKYGKSGVDSQTGSG